MGRHCNSPSARVTRSVGASYQTPRLGACGSVLWLPVSAIFLADVVSLPVGTGGSGVRGERRGWAGTPRTRAASIFDGNGVVAPTLFR
jgi:hypothetical protein